MNEHGERPPTAIASTTPTIQAQRQAATEPPAEGRGDGRARHDERRTEAGEWYAIWRFDHSLIRILLVHNISESKNMFRADTPSTAPDLAHMRERHPCLSSLWDAVRHQFWTESLGPGCRSPSRA